MERKVYFAADATLLATQGIAVIGYGNQGRAQALNLRDTGMRVCVGLRENSGARSIAEADGLDVMRIPDAVQNSDVVMLLVPDEVMGDLYRDEIKAYISQDTALGFAHGFAIHYRLIDPQEAGDVFMVSPKGTGEALRSNYKEGIGLSSCIAVHQDKSQQALQLALAYAQAIGCTKRGAFMTTFRQETESDLFTEQAVLCGAIGHLITTSFEVLVEAGYDPRLAYFECLTEAKLVCDLLTQEGFDGFRAKISNTAELGGHLGGKKIMPDDTKERMRALLQEIQAGKFAQEFMADYRAGFPRLQEFRAMHKNHLIDEVGAEMRSL